MKRIWAAAAAIAAVAVVVIGIVVWRTHASGISAGSVVEVDQLGADAQHLVVQVPDAAYTVQFTRPLSSFPTDTVVSSLDQGDQVKDGVAGGGRFVGIHLAPTVQTGMPSTVVAVSGTASPTLTLVSDGTSYALPATKELAAPDRAFYVALPSDPRTLDLEVGFDGVTQSLDLLGQHTDHAAAAPYYEPGMLPVSAYDATPCTSAQVRLDKGQFDPAPDESSPHVEIPAALVEVPYVDGLGWAAPGRHWLVVPLTTRFDRGTFVSWPRFHSTNPALYLPQLRRTTVIVDGQRPRALPAFFGQTGGALSAQGMSGAYYVFDVAGQRHALRLQQRYVGRLGHDLGSTPPGALRRVIGTVDCGFEIG